MGFYEYSPCMASIYFTKNKRGEINTMKSAKSIIGTSIINLPDGQEDGTVRALILNETKTRILSLIVELNDWYLPARRIDYGDVAALGSDAVLVTVSDPAKGVIMPKSIEAAIIEKNTDCIGQSVYTLGGEYIGRIKDYFINESNGAVVSVSLNNDEQIGIERIVLFGKNVCIVQ